MALVRKDIEIEIPASIALPTCDHCFSYSVYEDQEEGLSAVLEMLLAQKMGKPLT